MLLSAPMVVTRRRLVVSEGQSKRRCKALACLLRLGGLSKRQAVQDSTSPQRLEELLLSVLIKGDLCADLFKLLHG